MKVQIGVGSRISTPHDVIVSRISSQSRTIWIAVGVSLAVLALPVFLVSRGVAVHAIGERRYGTLAALFLDKETDTYSLSKFQFYAWTAVAVFGYIYLLLAQSLVQGEAVFPEIPDNLPGIILISAVTGALATGISNAKGPKGAGEVHPSFSDFITAGGVVVAERFQFFVWTVLGTIAFLFFVVTSDPGTIKDLPKIPDSFLQIMGISSFGYLGGKLVRKPGPVIDRVAPNPATAADAMPLLTLTITGQKLSQDASFRIDEKDIRLGDPVEGEATGKIGTTDAQRTRDDQEGFYKKLTLIITKPPKEAITAGEHKLTLTNPDGKSASWSYEIKPAAPAPQQPATR